jgi:hypothetical protein
VTLRHGLPAAIAFALLATANSGGYRYGVSDQAFYVPAIARHTDAALFPRDAALLDAQTHLWFGDEIIGTAARLVPDLPLLFAGLYAVTMVLLCTGGAMYMRSLGASGWATAAFLVILTLRHQIAKTGANTLEGYMHPRMLAFALGLAALAGVVKRRPALALIALVGAAALHSTTALWFGVIVGVALVDASRHRAGSIVAAAAAIAAMAVWAMTIGPLAGRLQVMDAEWLTIVEGRDYLFPTGWPLYAWILNLAYPVLIWSLFQQRRRLGLAVEGERALIVGLLVLVVVFLVSVPLSAMRIALAVQMQVNRVFWLLDVVAGAYLAWWLLDRMAPRFGPRLRPALIALLVVLSAARGAYVLTIDVQRPLVEIRPEGDWIDAMRWLRTQPKDWHVLADPQHGWKYGISVRVAALRDTVLELSKDTSIAMYDRAVAMRAAERMTTLRGFEQLSTERARALAARYDIDALILEQPAALSLPVLYRNERFVIYGLR